jgi:hypothetical protein
MTRWVIHAAWIAALTVLTQVGGAIYALALWTRKFTPRTRTITGFAALFVALYALLWFPVGWLASATGRSPLPCAERDGLSGSLFSCLLHRHYAEPDLVSIAAELARAVDARYPGTQTRTLDAGFPFFNGFPLAPHLSHDDGEKLDLAFYYARNGEYRAGALASPIGYWKSNGLGTASRNPAVGARVACGGTWNGSSLSRAAT